MSDAYKDFCEDYEIKFDDYLPDEIHAAFEAITSDESSSYECEGWYFDIHIEKIHALQKNIHVSATNEDDERICFYIVIESGINNGTVFGDYTLGNTDQPNSKEIEVFNGVEFNCHFSNDPRQTRKARIFFNANKSTIEDIIKKQNYDNHVTGGGTMGTNEHYRDKLSKFKGIYNVKYKTITVDI